MNMEIKFLGRGSAHNVEEGNTSAYFLDNNELFLIDCGEDAFSKLKKKDLLDNSSKIHILLTHTHSDHIGSIGSLITYCYYKLNKTVNIILSKNENHELEVKRVLDGFAVKSNMYNIVYPDIYENAYETFKSINYIKTEHSALLSCFGIIFETKEGSIFYSGDTSEIDLIKVLLKKPKKFYRMYLDMCDDPDNAVHMYIEDLNEVVPDNFKNRVYVMHFNSKTCIKKALDYGFNIVEVETVKKTIGIGVGVLLLNKKGEVLLLLRNDINYLADSDMHLEGSYTLPSGKVLLGETFESAGKRKLKDETNLEVDEKDLKLISLSNDKNEYAHYATIGLIASKHQGNFKLKDSGEFIDYGWFSINDLPNNLCEPSKVIINNYLKKEIYTKDL